MKNLGSGLIGFAAGIATMWGFAIYKEKASAVTLPAGTPYVYQGVPIVVAAATQSSALPIGATFLLGGHQYSVQPSATVLVS
jgi:hypothetical protein